MICLVFFAWKPSKSNAKTLQIGLIKTKKISVSAETYKKFPIFSAHTNLNF